jgi:hypothetical protein
MATCMPKETIRIGNQEITIEPIEVPEGEVFDPAAYLEKVMHDCPECRAARARGETPLVVANPALPAKRDVIRGRRPRWRTLKRRARR